MPPSAGACQTTLAELSPDCGRASNWSSIITATTWRDATAGETSRPVSGAGTSDGDGSGVGLGASDGEGSTDGEAGGALAGSPDGASLGVAVSDGVGTALAD